MRSKLTPELINKILLEAPADCWVVVHGAEERIIGTGASSQEAISNAQNAGYVIDDMLVIWSPPKPKAAQKEEADPPKAKSA